MRNIDWQEATVVAAILALFGVLAGALFTMLNDWLKQRRDGRELLRRTRLDAYADMLGPLTVFLQSAMRARISLDETGRRERRERQRLLEAMHTAFSVLDSALTRAMLFSSPSVRDNTARVFAASLRLHNLVSATETTGDSSKHDIDAAIKKVLNARIAWHVSVLREARWPGGKELEVRGTYMPEDVPLGEPATPWRS